MTSVDSQHGIRAEVSKMQQFDGKKFHLWKFRMTYLLKFKKLWGYVSGEIAKPEVEVEGRNTWEEKDDAAKTILCLSLDDTQLPYVLMATTSKEMWDKLGDAYEEKSTANVMQLKAQFHNFKKCGGDRMQMHINKLRELVQQLTAVGASIDEQDQIIVLLKSLPEEYKMMVTALKSQGDLIFEKVCSRLIQEEMDTNELSEDGEAAALLSRGVKVCYNCNKPGHIARECKSDRSVRTCYRCGKSGHLSNKCQNRDEEGSANRAVTFTARVEHGNAASKKQESEGWIIDSGASQDVCKRREVFKEVCPTDQVKRVYVGDNSIVEVKWQGDVPIELRIGSKKREGILKEVLYVPEMANNLFSVRRAAKQGMAITFVGNMCKIVDTRSGELVGVGYNEGDDLWHLQSSHSMTRKESTLQNEVTTNDRKHEKRSPYVEVEVLNSEGEESEMSQVKNEEKDEGLQEVNRLLEDKTKIEESKKEFLRRSTRTRREPSHLESYELDGHTYSNMAMGYETFLEKVENLQWCNLLQRGGVERVASRSHTGRFRWS